MTGTVITGLSIAALVPAAAALLIAEHGEPRGIVRTRTRPGQYPRFPLPGTCVVLADEYERQRRRQQAADRADREKAWKELDRLRDAAARGGRARMWTLLLGMLIGVVLTMLIVAGLLLLAGATALPEEEISRGPVSSDVDRSNVDVYG